MKKIISTIFMVASFVSVSFGVNTDYGIRVNDTLPSAQSVKNVTVGIKSGQAFYYYYHGWRASMMHAIQLLNNEIYDAGSSVKFKWTGSSNANVLMEYGTLPSGTAARTDIGDNSHGIGKKMIINGYINLSFKDKIETLKHELLHTIGFRHSRTGSEISYGSVMVTNTNSFWEWQYFGHSIMETSLNKTPFNLSELDKRALRTIFP